MRGATAAGKLMALHRLFDKAGGLFLSLSLVARKPHPLPNDGPARLLFVHFVAPDYVNSHSAMRLKNAGNRIQLGRRQLFDASKRTTRCLAKLHFQLVQKASERRPWLKSCFWCYFVGVRAYSDLRADIF
jgi:hypothetical protein